MLWFSNSVISRGTCEVPVGVVFSLKAILIGSLALPVRISQSTVCTAKLHSLPLVGTSVQVTLVWLVVVGQLPQFEARML